MSVKSVLHFKCFNECQNTVHGVQNFFNWKLEMCCVFYSVEGFHIQSAVAVAGEVGSLSVYLGFCCSNGCYKTRYMSVFRHTMWCHFNSNFLGEPMKFLARI